MSKNPIMLSYDFLKNAEEVKKELENAKKINPDDDSALLGFQMCLALWLSKFIPKPVALLSSNISEFGDATIKDPDFIRSQNDKYNNDLIKGIHHIIKKHDFTFDTTKDIKIIFDDKYVATIPKDTIHKFNLIQKFVSSVELVYSEITSHTATTTFSDIEKYNAIYDKYYRETQNIRVDFVADPESYLGKIVNDFEHNKKANDELYKTPVKETTMTHTTSSFNTHSQTPSPQCNISNSGGKINFTLLIPVIVCTIPLGGGGGASFCAIM